MDIATFYSSLAGLSPGSPMFVGRMETLHDMFLRLSHPDMPGIAVVGPRRSGKTSLLKQLLSPEFRARHRREAAEWGGRLRGPFIA